MLLKELQSLALDMKVLTENKEELAIKDLIESEDDTPQLREKEDFEEVRLDYDEDEDFSAGFDDVDFDGDDKFEFNSKELFEDDDEPLDTTVPEDFGDDFDDEDFDDDLSDEDDDK